MNIYIIRHGQTQSNLKNQYYGRLDVPLTDQGVQQMKALSFELSNIQFDKIYTSNARRALESLEICLPTYHHQAIIDERLCEINFGDFEGKTYQEISKEYPQEVIHWQRDWKNFLPPQGESFIQFYLRVSDIFKEIISNEVDNIFIMAHSGVIKAIYCYVLGQNLDLYWNFTCHNGKINIIQYEYGNLFIDAVNRGSIR